MAPSYMGHSHVRHNRMSHICRTQECEPRERGTRRAVHDATKGPRMKMKNPPEIPAKFAAVAVGAGVGLSIVAGTAYRRSRTRLNEENPSPPRGFAARFTTPLLPDDFL